MPDAGRDSCGPRKTAHAPASQSTLRETARRGDGTRETDGDDREDERIGDEWREGSCLRPKEARGAPRRCGGQGDVVSGAVAAFLAAERTRRSSGDHPGGDDEEGESEGDYTYGVSPLRLRRHLAAAGGCLVTRAAARRAFERRKLATLAGDVVEELGPAMEEAWPVGGGGEDGDEATRT